MSDIISIAAGRLGLILGLPARGMPEFLGFGPEATVPDFWPGVNRARRVNGMDIAVPSSVLLPVGGLGFFGWPAIQGHRDGVDFTLDFSGWTARNEGRSTILEAQDGVSGISIAITFDPSPTGVLAVSTRLTNLGAGVYTLDRCMAASFPVGVGPCDVTSFTGMWGREYQTRREVLGNAVWLQESRRGRTSHDRFPMISVEADGQSAGFHLGWSGNHVIAIDRLDDGRRLVHLGELFEPGEMRLSPGEAYQSPTAYAGLDSASFHAFVRSDLIDWPGGRMSPRPVTLNTWEGNYFDHKIRSLKDQATAAAALGIERFVLDDGWFGKRDDDTTSLGDWEIDTRKYPNGLKPLVDHVTGLGMEFGLWFEPEMISPDSDLYRAHPDWALQIAGRPLLLSRDQLVLDLTRPEISDHIFRQIDQVLSTHAVSYVKWDMNRDLTHVGGRDGRAKTGAQTRAVYALMDRVRAAHPSVEIESCASGGARIDYGVLARTQRVWTSDCIDALERLEIQRGASVFLPAELMGSHISSVPNHQTGRRHTLSFRALVAMAYHLGVELNPLELTAEERTELAAFIATHKRLRPFLHAPGSQFQTAPIDGRYVWGAADERRIALFVAQGPQMVGEQPAPLKTPVAARAGELWRIAAVHPAKPDFIRVSDGQKQLLDGTRHFSLETLRSAGLPLPMLRPESAILLELEPVGGGAAHG